MINAEDLRIGDIVQTNKDCMFPKGTLCVVTDIHPDRQHNDNKGVVSLKAVNDDDDGPWGHGAVILMACPSRLSLRAIEEGFLSRLSMNSMGLRR